MEQVRCFDLHFYYSCDMIIGRNCTEEARNGDGVVDIGEDCDDGNTQSGDGCSASASIESGYVCSDSALWDSTAVSSVTFAGSAKVEEVQFFNSNREQLKPSLSGDAKLHDGIWNTINESNARSTEINGAEFTFSPAQQIEYIRIYNSRSSSDDTRALSSVTVTINDDPALSFVVGTAQEWNGNPDSTLTEGQCSGNYAYNCFVDLMHDATQSKCEVLLTCDIPTNPIDGTTFVCEGTKSEGDNCTYTCDTTAGYQPGSKTITCQSDGSGGGEFTSSSGFTCQAITCNQPTFDADANDAEFSAGCFDSDNSVDYGTECKLQCKNGFEGTSAFVVKTCQATDSFASFESLECTRKCGAIPDVKVGEIFNCSESDKNGDTCTATCNSEEGYTGSGSSYDCGANGDWTLNTMGTCTLMQCAKLSPAPDFSTTTCAESTNFNSTCEYTCESDYNGGSVTYRCALNGDLTPEGGGSGLSCSIKTCPVPENPGFENTEYNCTAGGTESVGTVCTVSCDSTTFGGVSSRTCTKYGNFSGEFTDPSCTATPQCTAPSFGPATSSTQCTAGLLYEETHQCIYTCPDSGYTSATMPVYECDGTEFKTRKISVDVNNNKFRFYLAQAETNIPLILLPDTTYTFGLSTVSDGHGFGVRIVDTSTNLLTSNGNNDYSFTPTAGNSYEYYCTNAAHNMTNSIILQDDLCEIVKCPLLDNFGFPTTNDCSSEPEFEDECDYSCGTGYQTNSTTYVCDASGAFVPKITALQCTPEVSSCPDQPIPSDSTVETFACTSNGHGDVCQALCNTGYSGTGSNSTCNDGTWQNPIGGSCTKVTCSVDTMPSVSHTANTCAGKASVNYSDVCTLSCDTTAGYQAATSDYTCLQSGNMDGNTDFRVHW